MGERGPAPKTLNWIEVDKLAEMHCTQKEIAAFFNISVDTLERACLRDHKVKLADYYAQKKKAGLGRLRKIQWNQAEEGSTSMAIFLGKHLLGQSDKPLDEEIIEAAHESGLSREDLLNLIRNPAKYLEQKGSVVKKSFVEFCLDAGYPEPYPKQIEMANFGINENVARLLLGARGYGKTDYAVICRVAYKIYLDPKYTFLIMTKSKERNAAILNEILQACIKNGVAFEKMNSNFIRVLGHKGKDHSVSAVTVRTISLRGRHPDEIIMDDPVTEDDTSEATRTLIEKKYNELFKLCKNLFIIGQPAHKYDLYAKLRGLIKTMEVPHGTIPQLDHDLEAQRLAGVDEASISASYHLKILAEGATPFDNIKYVDYFPSQSSVAFIDPASEGTDSTALSIITKQMEGIFVVGFKWRKAWNHCLDDIAPLLQKYQVGKLCFETNSLGEQPLDILRQVFGTTGVVGRKSHTNKHARIMAAGAYAHMIHLSKESMKSYLDEVVQYEYGAKHDDAPDSMATGFEWIGLIRGKQ